MRLRIFTGPTVTHAMEQVRTELGDEAVIVHVEAGRRGGPAHVTAAVEQLSASRPAEQEHSAPKPGITPDIAELPALLRYHGLPPALTRALCETTRKHFEADLHEALAAALDSRLRFRPLRGRVEEQVVLVGQPGQGKTLMAARLAAMAAAAGRKSRIVTTDCEAAGAMAQLTAFCQPLNVEVVAAATPQLAEQQLQARFDGLQIIDTPGINPYALSDVETLARLLRRLHAEPVWVISANTDAQEASDMGEIFASLGVRRLIASRADSTRRFSAVLALLTRCKLALAGFSDSPFVGDGIQPGHALALAQRLIDRPDPTLIARYTKAQAA